MNKDFNFETYLFVSSKELNISVQTDLNKKIFEKKLIINQYERKLIFD